MYLFSNIFAQKVQKNVFLCVQKNNHPPKPLRKPFGEWYNTAKSNPVCKPFIEAQNQRLKQFFVNHRHLCRIRGISEHGYLKEVYKATGFKVSDSFYSQLKSGARATANQYVFMMLAACHGYDAIDMMLQDLTKSGEVPKVA